MRNPIKVAITGRIGTGKTTICTLLKKEGFQVFESDKDLIFFENSVKIFSFTFFLVNSFLTSLSDEKGNLNRKVLGNFLFSKKLELNKVEKILYPLLEIEKKKFLTRNCNKSCLFFDIPLLFEKKLHNTLDKIIYLKVDKKIQKQRVLRRDGMNEKKLKQILANQNHNFNYYKKFVSLEIDSSESKSLIRKKLQKFIKTF